VLVFLSEATLLRAIRGLFLIGIFEESPFVFSAARKLEINRTVPAGLFDLRREPRLRVLTGVQMSFRSITQFRFPCITAIPITELEELTEDATLPNAVHVPRHDSAQEAHGR
jgi:hypothetical protein